ncbi:MAG: ClpXP protease specificity-enhancing factor [Sinobacterium sp.]|nr:ClpXP protease specificity-enhancing factor [Sinobacterium sp.]
MDAMTSSKPYFVRAVFDWIVDNNCTPYLSVFAGFPDVEVPVDFVVDEHITLNISPTAVVDFHFDDEAISFKARFSGVSRTLYIPMAAIVGLFAKENGHGMGFPEESIPESHDEESSENQPSEAPLESVLSEVPSNGVQGKKTSKKVSHLKVIK